MPDLMKVEIRVGDRVLSVGGVIHKTWLGVVMTNNLCFCVIIVSCKYSLGGFLLLATCYNSGALGSKEIYNIIIYRYITLYNYK